MAALENEGYTAGKRLADGALEDSHAGKRRRSGGPEAAFEELVRWL